jgi:hypothetical protein
MTQTSFEKAMNRAVGSLRSHGIRLHVHSQRCINILKHVLYKDEETVLEARESYLKSIAPFRLVATKKRLILVNPSFWGLYTGHDILNPTHYAIVPYKYIIGVSLSKGLLFSSIKIHTSGGVDPGSVVMKGDEDEIHGVDSKQAVAMTTFIEEVIEYEDEEEKAEERGATATRAEERARQRPQAAASDYGIPVAECRDIVNSGKAKFVWMGVEPLDDVARVLGVRKDDIIQLSGSHLLKHTDEQIKALGEIILVSYDGLLGEHTAKLMKKRFGSEPKMLRGGMVEAARSAKEGADAFLS